LFSCRIFTVINHNPVKVCLARRCLGTGPAWGLAMAISDIPILSMLRRGGQGPDHDHAWSYRQCPRHRNEWPGLAAAVPANRRRDVGCGGSAIPRAHAGGVAGNIIQHRLVWSLEALRPKLSKISPAAGLKRIFSKQSLANLGKDLIKLVLIGSVLTVLMWPERERLEALTRSDLSVILPLCLSLALKLMGAVVAMLAVVAAADYLFQYRQWHERQKMSLRELKEEFKQAESDPAIKGKMKQVRQVRMRFPELRWLSPTTTRSPWSMSGAWTRRFVWPRAGVDAMALKIREVAGKHSVPIVENPPLARALHATVEVDQQIPPEHYKAVAEVIGYVMRLRRMVSGRR
jgi:flagellar biosynthesis protein FlhB